MSWYRTTWTSSTSTRPGRLPLFISGSEREHAITIADAVKRLENFLLDGLCPEHDLAVAAAA